MSNMIQVPVIVPLPSGVDVFMPTGEEFETFWTEIEQYDTLFGNDYMHDKKRYQGVLLKADTVPLRFDGGYAIFSALRPELTCEVHPIFLDRKMSVHADLFRSILTWMFLQYRLLRIETFIGEYAHSVKRFTVKKMGFVHEGTLRDRIIHRGTPMNVDVYSILRGEVLE